ncbi:RluA family pseudouridine synthase, partial [bacterium]
TSVQKAISGGKVLVNGKKIDKPNYKVKIDEDIQIIIEDKKANLIEGEDIPLKVVFEDTDLAVIDKQAGLVVHPAPGNYQHTLVNALLHRFGALSDINSLRPGIVHRLDKDTSGILVIAKNNVAHLNLAKQFAEHSIKRRYVALVNGRMEFDENVIEMPIGRHPHKRESMSVGFGKKTRYAKTYYHTVKRTPEFSLLELEPFTGRTHQLRVHLAFIGHPILGDMKYGKNNPFSRLALHAKYIGFIHPRTGKFVEFSSPTPPEFTDFINNQNKS